MPQLGKELAKAREEEQLLALENYLKGALGDMDGVGGSTDDEILNWIGEHTSSSATTARTVMRCLLETVPVSFVECVFSSSPRCCHD